MKRTLARAIGSLALAGACATTPKVIPRPGPAPAADELLRALTRRQDAVRTLEMETRTTSWLGGERIRGTVSMLIERGGRLLFSYEATLQGTVAQLVVHKGEFALVDLEQKVFRKGRACPANVATLIKIPLSPEEIAAILLGDAPLGAGVRAVEVGWDAARGADVLAVERPAVAAEATTRLWITLRRTAAGADVLAVEGQSARRTGRWRVSYEDLAGEGGVTLPALIRFAEPGRSFDEGVEIKLRERYGLNRPLRDEAFVLTPPPGYPVETVPCPGGQ